MVGGGTTWGRWGVVLAGCAARRGLVGSLERNMMNLDSLSVVKGFRCWNRNTVPKFSELVRSAIGTRSSPEERARL